jgi:hypothetical protein
MTDAQQAAATTDNDWIFDHFHIVNAEQLADTLNRDDVKLVEEMAMDFGGGMTFHAGKCGDRTFFVFENQHGTSAVWCPMN